MYDDPLRALAEYISTTSHYFKKFKYFKLCEMKGLGNLKLKSVTTYNLAASTQRSMVQV